MKRQDTLKGWMLFSFALGFILFMLPFVGANHLSAPNMGLLYFFIAWAGIIILLIVVAITIKKKADARSLMNGDDVGHD